MQLPSVHKPTLVTVLVIVVVLFVLYHFFAKRK